jgi:ketosteroid isomerase-like protein
MRSLMFAALLPAITIACAAQAETGPGEVRRAIAGMNVAASKLDADTFMGWYWNSPSLVITFDGEVMRGWQNILAAQRGWWSDKKNGVRFTQARAPEIASQGCDVVTTIQWMDVADPKSALPSKLVITSVWRKRAEGWRIVLAHESLMPPSR